MATCRRCYHIKETGEGGGKRRMKRAIFPLFVVGLFLAVAASSAMGSTPTPQANEKVLNIVMGVDNQKFTKNIVTADQAQIELFSNQIKEFQTWIGTARPFKDLQLTDEEKNEIKAKVTDILTSLNAILQANGLDPIDMEMVFRDMFDTEIGRSTIVSVGVGYAFIPFYEYEAFLGVMLRPMWLLYPPIFMLGGGYTGHLNIKALPPRIEYGDRLGSHIVRTTMFNGLYLNIGELGYDRLIGPGVMILLGKARVAM
jgi:hypothetical protein